MGVEIAHSIDELLGSVDALMMLRVQRERLGPSDVAVCRRICLLIWSQYGKTA